MLRTLGLLVPALVPSWAFFDEITASPRVEFALLRNEGEEPAQWREFRPRPQHVSLARMARRMVWNPRWNETLFMVSCAERIIAGPNPHAESEIFNRIARWLGPGNEGLFLQFRLVLVYREGEALRRETEFISPVRALAGLDMS